MPSLAQRNLSEEGKSSDSDLTCVQELLFKNEACLLLLLVIGYEVRDRLCREKGCSFAPTCNRCTYLPERISLLPALALRRARHLVARGLTDHRHRRSNRAANSKGKLLRLTPLLGGFFMRDQIDG